MTEKVETDNNNATEQVQRLLGEKHTKSVEIAMLSKEVKELKNSSFNPKSISQRPNDSSKFKVKEEITSDDRRRIWNRFRDDTIFTLQGVRPLPSS